MKKSINEIILIVVILIVSIFFFKMVSASFYASVGDSYSSECSYLNAITCYRASIAQSMNEQNKSLLKSKIKKTEELNKNNICNTSDMDYNIRFVEDRVFLNLKHIKIKEMPPYQLYYLVIPKGNLKPDTLPKVREILTILWQEEDARKLITVLLKRNIPIYISKKGAYKENRSYMTGTVYLTVYNQPYLEGLNVNIMESSLQYYKTAENDPSGVIYTFRGFLHEFCHTAGHVLNQHIDNSLEEELFANMISENTIYKLALGRELTDKEADYYSKQFLKILLTDEDVYRKLQIYNGFTNIMKTYRIIAPHEVLYQNIPELYKKIRNDPDTKKLDTLEKMI